MKRKAKYALKIGKIYPAYYIVKLNEPQCVIGFKIMSRRGVILDPIKHVTASLLNVFNGIPRKACPNRVNEKNIW